MGIIESTSLWPEAMEARNRVAHEYPDDPQLTAKYLNKIYDFAPLLIGILESIKKRTDQRRD